MNRMPAWLSEDLDVIRGYSRDLRGFGNDAIGLARPHAHEQVAQALQLARDRGWKVVVQGGNTGLAGGAVPETALPTMILSTRGLRSIGEIDERGWCEVGAGVTLAELSAHAREQGWEIPVDFASRESATLGGAVATNAGGVKAIRYGQMNRWVRGVRAVTGDGATFDYRPAVVKDNSGLRLFELFTGSEGVIGVITAVVVELVPALRDRMTLWVEGEESELFNLAAAWKAAPHELDALEFMDEASLGLIGRSAAGALLVEGPRTWLESRGASLHVEGEAAVSDRDRQALWARREQVAVDITARSPVLKCDVSIPSRSRRAVLAIFREAVLDCGGQPYVFGHIGDDNLHLNAEVPTHQMDRIEAKVMADVAAVGGSISAEHGIGAAKRPWVGIAREAEELVMWRRIKLAFDPDWLLAPGVLLEFDPGVASDQH